MYWSVTKCTSKWWDFFKKNKWRSIRSPFHVFNCYTVILDARFWCFIPGDKFRYLKKRLWLSGSSGEADLAECEIFVAGDMAESRCLASKAQGKYCNRKFTLLLIERSSKYCLYLHNLTKPGPGQLVWLLDVEDLQHVQASSHSRNEESLRP